MTTFQSSSVAGPVRDLIGYGSAVPKVFWPDDAYVAVNLVINYEEGSEYSYPSGDGRNEALGEVAYSMPSEYRDLSVESTYEYGSRAGIWRLFRVLDEYSVPATVFAAAVALEKNPQVAEAMRKKGHDLLSHGWRWSEHWTLSREEEESRINAAISSFQSTFGERPYGWYCRYGASVNTRDLIVKEGGFLYDSDAYNDDLPYFSAGYENHLVVPYSLTYNDLQGSRTPGEYVDFWKRALAELWREGREGRPKMMSIGMHPRIMGQAGRAAALREFIEYAQELGHVWFARRLDIAKWWLAHSGDFQG